MTTDAMIQALISALLPDCFVVNKALRLYSVVSHSAMGRFDNENIEVCTGFGLSWSCDADLACWEFCNARKKYIGDTLFPNMVAGDFVYVKELTDQSGHPVREFAHGGKILSNRHPKISIVDQVL